MDRQEEDVVSNEEWGVRYPNGEIEPAGILGENRARMLVARYGYEIVRLRSDGQPIKDGDPS